MASYKLFRCWWRDYSANNSVFYDLSDYCKFSDLNWSAKLSNEPIEFSFSLSIPEVSNNPVYPESGDEILFTMDSTKFQVVSNALYGLITDPGKAIVSYDPANARINYTYNITVQQKDFSGYSVINQTWENQTLSAILDDLMDYTLDSFLGGVTDGSTFAKYKLICPDITITTFTVEDLTAREAIEKLCNENNLYYKMQYFSYPASTVNLKVISQIFILNQSGQAPPDTSSWSQTLDNTNLFKGLILNPLYSTNTTLPQYVASESGFTYSEDRDIIRNYIQLEAYATDDTPGTITFNRIIAPSSLQDTYTLPYQASDIVYVGVYSNYESYIKGYVATTTTTFGVPSHVAATLKVGNTIRIEYNSDFYLRVVSNVNTGTDTITISEAMPAGFARAANYQINIGEALEVVGNVTIYEDNQDTDLTTGVVKNIQLGEKAQIRFLPNSIPSLNQVIVTGYYEIKNYKQSQFNHASIEKYGLRRYKQTLAEPLTRSQITEIFNSLLLPDPNVTIGFYSDRIDLIEIGHQINLNMANFYTGSLICTAVKMQTISGLNWNNQQHVRQYITLSTLVEDLADILKRITQSVKQYKPTGPENLKGKQPETVSILDSFTYVKSPAPPPNYLIYTERVSGYDIPKKVNLDTLVSSALFTPAATTNYRWISYNAIRNKIVYRKNTSIYIANVDGTSETLIIASGDSPIWSFDGQYVFYSGNSDQKVRRYEIDTTTDIDIFTSAVGVGVYYLHTTANNTTNKISFNDYYPAIYDIYTCNFDGSGLSNIFDNSTYYEAAFNTSGNQLSLSTEAPSRGLTKSNVNGSSPSQYVSGKDYRRITYFDDNYIFGTRLVVADNITTAIINKVSVADGSETLIVPNAGNYMEVADQPFVYI